MKYACPKTALALLMCGGDAIVCCAQTLTSLVQFDYTNGYQPQYDLLAQGADGNFYGTASLGGASAQGTVFRMSPAGSLTTIHNFTFTDGEFPSGALVLEADGTLYGTTQSGGASGVGTIYKLSPSGLTTLYSFTSADGGQPVAGLIRGRHGHFYGTTYSGGAYARGSIFEVTPQGVLTTLHSFHSSDGSRIYGGLVQAPNGDLYGTASKGGAEQGGGRTNCCGTVFKISPEGVFGTLHIFQGPDGATPMAGLILAGDGNFYGTTSYGGAFGDGTVFRMNPEGALVTLYSFGGPDGLYPEGGLVQASDGNLYGATVLGGPSCDVSYDGCGTIFRITTAGTLTTLVFFSGADGDGPNCTLMQGADGSLYGTTFTGGYRGASSGDGTVFRLTLGTSGTV
jgi:uncharacterized repeat protein (TIGR03803 family)